MTMQETKIGKRTETAPLVGMPLVIPERIEDFNPDQASVYVPKDAHDLVEPLSYKGHMPPIGNGRPYDDQDMLG